MGPRYRNYESTSPLFDCKYKLISNTNYGLKIFNLVLNNRRNNCNITNLLVSAGANLDYKNNYGYTALITGKFIFSKNINKKLIYSFTLASRLGFIDIVNILIKAGSLIDAGDTNGQTALMAGKLWSENMNYFFWYKFYIASVNGFNNVMTALITAGANVNKTDDDGRSALTLGNQTIFLLYKFL